ncbi:UvrD-helicase domain-containing protein, partial [Patescibacteria group bacterium]|nr:UvrD-helicase domain-containing protein [Patescibacteria group bacterium]
MANLIPRCCHKLSRLTGRTQFQDTSALQVDIFRKIAEAGHSKFFLVGDPCQSIYGFAGR